MATLWDALQHAATHCNALSDRNASIKAKELKSAELRRAIAPLDFES